MTKRIENDYPYSVAGRVWVIPHYELTQLPDGSLVVLKAELDRVHRAIANAICGSRDRLTVEELDFLCHITSTTYTDLARLLDLHKSTLSRWKRPGDVPSKPTSTQLKRWFWTRLFAADLPELQVPVAVLESDDAVLAFLHDQALAEGAAERVLRRVA